MLPALCPPPLLAFRLARSSSSACWHLRTSSFHPLELLSNTTPDSSSFTAALMSSAWYCGMPALSLTFSAICACEKRFNGVRTPADTEDEEEAEAEAEAERAEDEAAGSKEVGGGEGDGDKQGEGELGWPFTAALEEDSGETGGEAWGGGRLEEDDEEADGGGGGATSPSSAAVEAIAVEAEAQRRPLDRADTCPSHPL